jgi:hypothetical protein
MDVEEEAARGEIERLRGMAGLDLAVRIMKAWRQDPGATRSQAELAAWLLRDYPDAAGLLPLLRTVVRETCELLGDEGLLEERQASYVVSQLGEAGSASGRLSLARRGQRIMAQGDLDGWAGRYLRSRLAAQASGMAGAQRPGGGEFSSRPGSSSGATMPNAAEPRYGWGTDEMLEQVRDAQFFGEMQTRHVRPASPPRGDQTRRRD